MCVCVCFVSVSVSFFWICLSFVVCFSCVRVFVLIGRLLSMEGWGRRVRGRPLTWCMAWAGAVGAVMAEVTAADEARKKEKKEKKE